MQVNLDVVMDLIVIGILIVGIRLFRSPKGARFGNLTAAFALGLAMAATLVRYDISSPTIVIGTLVAGSFVGWLVAQWVNMIQIPAMVAFQHGAGGIAAFVVAFVELTRASSAGYVGEISGIIGLIVGAGTFSGSMIASAKLANKIRQTPTVFSKHNWFLVCLVAVIASVALQSIVLPQGNSTQYLLIALIALSIGLGVLFSIRIGGADMPVLISFLNATAGLAAALCGIIIQNKLLIALGATVAASGSILTHVMCKAMNRSLANVFVGIKAVRSKSKPVGASPVTEHVETSVSSPANAGGYAELAAKTARDAKSVVIIPGYGMALAHAQFKVVELVKVLEQMGKEVKFAIHPVAGRMPGHMNVLLAEADVPYDQLYEMDDINPLLPDTDLVLIIGACDVVNPAAIQTEGTPISGMPILNAHQAKHVIVCNLDERPGYSGVENPLYKEDKTIMLLGDAKQTLDELLKILCKTVET